MIKIIKINWLSEVGKEAEIYLFDGDFNIIAFSHPFNHDLDYKIPLPLYTLNAKEVYALNNEKKFSVEKGMTAFGYKLSGCVVNKNDNQIKIGEFIIELDLPLPNDIEVGSFISFMCDRIDLW